MKNFYLFICCCLIIVIFYGCRSYKDIPEKKSRILFQKINKRNHQEYIDFIINYAPAEDAFVAVQRIAAPFIEIKDWNGAIQVFEQYKSLFPEMSVRFEKIISMLKEKDDPLIINKLNNINTKKYQEYIPVPSSDGKTLYFCSKGRPDGIGGEDIYYSEIKNNEWQKPQLIPNFINTNYPEAPLSISTDGNYLVIFGNYDDSFGQGDMWYVQKTENGWSNKIHFPEPINSTFFDSDGSFTSDGKAFIFVSSRPGGIGSYHEKDEPFHGSTDGNTDIWICLKTDKDWSEPINLGSKINTPYAERTPFLHPDGKTLYFSSDGHYGLGSFDVFKSVRLSDSSWTDWSEPVNLGKNINTFDADWGYMFSSFGDSAYYSNFTNDQLDIFSITLPKKAKPEKFIATISGKVIDEIGKPIQSYVKWENIENGENLGVSESNPQNGEFFIILPVGKNYSYFAEKTGYYPITKNIDLKEIKENTKINIDITLISKKTIEEGKPIILSNIFFDYDKYILKEESFTELKKIVELFKEYPNWVIQISGYTDSKGGDEYNQKLSQNRAQSVVDYIVSKGIDISRIKAIGHGKASPIATNETEEGRERNRRVEFNVLKSR
jgi:outer membrane protein OmpA-like peptidoglycan-associated protein